MVTGARPPLGDTTTELENRFSVLIADDDRGNREALGEALEQRGFRTLLAEDGGRAVELVQVDLVHLILTDMHMPRLTGLEAFAVIRQTLDRMLPAVLMTADATNDLIRRAFQAQVFSVIPKPVNLNIVLNTLSRALAKAYGTAGPTAPAPPTPPPANPDRPA
jgi:CheY-like chemotaxis protein